MTGDLGSRLTTDEQDDLSDLMLGLLTNGPWVLIPHPSLRDLVGRYVAGTVAELAAAVGFADVEAAAREVRGKGSLPTTF